MKSMTVDNTGTYPKTIKYSGINTTGSVTGMNTSGIYCSCGNRMYHDGKMWRCPLCHDGYIINQINTGD